MPALLIIATVLAAYAVGLVADLALCAWEDTRWQREQSRRLNTHTDMQGRR